MAATPAEEMKSWLRSQQRRAGFGRRRLALMSSLLAAYTRRILCVCVVGGHELVRMTEDLRVCYGTTTT